MRISAPIKRLGIGCAILAILIVLGLFIWRTSDSYYLNSVDRGSADMVAVTFVLSLMENRPVKPLVAPELWPEIDEWMAEHKAVSCPASFSGDETYGVGYAENEKEIVSYTVALPCPDFRHYYYLSIEGIILESTDGRWQITGWESICETSNWQDGCYR